MLIGRFEQPVIYEGIHKLCFSCGRIGHRIEACPLIIKKPKTPVEGGPIGGGVKKSTNQGADQRGSHDSHSTDTGSGTSNNRGTGTEEDGYNPWMLVARRKLGQKRTNFTGNTEAHAGHGLGQTAHGLRQESKGVTGSVFDIKKGVEFVGPSNVGRVLHNGRNKVDEHHEARFSRSVKGKRVLARTRAIKVMSKPDVGHFAVNNYSGGIALGKGGDGECAGDSFQFTASGRTEVEI